MDRPFFITELSTVQHIVNPFLSTALLRGWVRIEDA